MSTGSKRILYVIGGVPRVGKDESAKKMKELGIVGKIISTDLLRPNVPNPDIIAWNICVNLIKGDISNFDIAVAGIAPTPKRVYDLECELNNFLVKAIFIGYGNESYADVILEHANNNPATDYIYTEEIRRKQAGEKTHRESMPEEMKRSEELKKEAANYGYDYYGAVRQENKDKHIKIIIDRLLSTRKLN